MSVYSTPARSGFVCEITFNRIFPCGSDRGFIWLGEGVSRLHRGDITPPSVPVSMDGFCSRDEIRPLLTPGRVCIWRLHLSFLLRIFSFVLFFPSFPSPNRSFSFICHCRQKPSSLHPITPFLHFLPILLQPNPTPPIYLPKKKSDFNLLNPSHKWAL